jgi:hypothetical protein
MVPTPEAEPGERRQHKTLELKMTINANSNIDILFTKSLVRCISVFLDFIYAFLKHLHCIPLGFVQLYAYVKKKKRKKTFEAV